MRVLNLIQRPQRRGAETFACDLSWWLRRNGHEARVVSLYPHTGPAPRLDVGDDCLGGNERALLERALDPVLLVSMIRAIRAFGPDVVQCNGGRTLKYAAPARLAAPNALWVYRNIDSPRFWLRSRMAKAVMPRLVRGGFDAAIGVSVATLAEVHACYGFAEASVAIENGVDFERIDPVLNADASAALAPGAKKILWVGALNAQKRPDVALEVLSRLPESFSLTLLGEGPWRQRVEQQVDMLGIANRVRVLGNRAEVGDLMRAGDMLLMTSDTEGIPAVVVEAQHCGLPVVGFDVGGLGECVPRNGPGQLVRHGDVGALVAAVIETGRDAGSATVRSSCTTYAEQFSIESIGPRYLDFYDVMMSTRSARQRGPR